MDQPNNQPPGSSWPPSPNPAPNSVPNPAGTARLAIVASYPPLAFLYGLFTPTITINGQRQYRPWGTHYFDLPPGNYEVSVSYPWLFMSECGKNTVRFPLQAGETRTVAYQASYIRYLPGNISVY